MQLTAEQRNILARSPLFYRLDPDELLPLLQGSLSELPAGQYLFMEGDLVERVYVLLSGSLHAGHVDKKGREFLSQLLRPSYLAGAEIACTPRKNAPYHIYAAEDSLLWSCSWEDLQGSRIPMELQLRLLENMMFFVSNQNIRKYYKIEALSMRSARERILRYLEAQAFRSGSPSFSVPMDRQEMANYLCINRSVLSHELKKMEAEGLISFRKNQFTLRRQ